MTGLCACGCGERTKLAPKTDRRRGWLKGEPMKFIHGHQHRQHVRTLEPPNPSGLCMCGCGEKTPTADRTHLGGRSWKIAGEHMRYVPGHQSRSAPDEYVVDPVNGCWIWQRYLHPRGYGWTGKGFAHRVFYERHVGAIPDGHVVHHLCENKRCVNPAHLQPMTPAAHKRLHPAEVWIVTRRRCIGASEDDGGIVGAFSNETAARARAEKGDAVDRHEVLSV